jgi:hypothetical protein
MSSWPDQSKISKILCQKQNTNQRRAIAQVVEHFPSKHKHLSLIPVLPKEKSHCVTPLEINHGIFQIDRGNH